ncbi:unnamed protein product [marine sediment metagenome]|uniref:Zinc ribbon domain-containing protein n=1 Tax=marine sediment metagenome TaxID=412755 RepID=X1UHP2_9ZZZZ
MSHIVTFNEKLKDLVDKAKGYDNLKNYKKSIKAWIEISEFCLKFAGDPKIDITYKNMLVKKIRNIINHVKSLKLKMQQKEQRIIELDEKKISALIDDLPEPPIGEPEALDSSVDNGTIKDDIISLDQKVKSIKDLKNTPNGFKQIKPKTYDFKTIIPKNQSRPMVNLEKESPKKEDKLKKPTRSCPFCGGEIGIDEKICSHCGT